MYTVVYKTSTPEATLRGKCGMDSHDGSGIAGVLVSYR
jgi:hypothetical protein